MPIFRFVDFSTFDIWSFQVNFVSKYNPRYLIDVDLSAQGIGVFRILNGGNMGILRKVKTLQIVLDAFSAILHFCAQFTKWFKSS